MSDCDPTCVTNVESTIALASQSLAKLSTQSTVVTSTTPLVFINPITITGGGVTNPCNITGTGDISIAGGSSVAKSVCISNNLNSNGSLTVPSISVAGECLAGGSVTFNGSLSSVPIPLNAISVSTPNQMIQIGSAILGLGGTSPPGSAPVTFPIPYVSAPTIFLQVWSSTDSIIQPFDIAPFVADIAITGFTIGTDLFNLTPSLIPDFDFINEFVVDWMAIGTVAV
jgi:hypothetical protein